MRRANLFILGMVVAIVIAGLGGWGLYKAYQQEKGVRNSELEKSYQQQRDSTKKWKEAFKKGEEARAHMRDSLADLYLANAKTQDEADRSQRQADSLQRELASRPRPADSDSTNPEWRRRAILLEKQNVKLSESNDSLRVVIQRDSAKVNLLVSQMSRDSIDLRLANSNVVRLDKMVKQFRDKAYCRILGLIPCPSRTQAFVAGAATVVGVAVAERHRK